jgi:hypothetical protein
LAIEAASGSEASQASMIARAATTVSPAPDTSATLCARVGRCIGGAVSRTSVIPFSERVTSTASAPACASARLPASSTARSSWVTMPVARVTSASLGVSTLTP